MNSSAIGLAMVGLLAASMANAQIKVNNSTIPQSKVDYMIKGATGQGQADTPELRAAIRDELINRELLAQEAVKKGLDKSSEVAMQMDLQRQGVLINAYLVDYAKSNPISEESMRKEYEQTKAKIGDREFKVRHILVEKEDEAKEITSQIKKGGNFEKIAAEKSKDPGSKGNGGDLGWSTPRQYVPAFAQAITKLKKGQMTDAPVQTQFGWHVIRLDDERAAKFPPYEEVKNQIQQQLRQQLVQKAVADLRAKAKIE